MGKVKKWVEEYRQQKENKRFSDATSTDNLLSLAGSVHELRNKDTTGYISLSKRWNDLYKRALDYYNNEAYKGFYDAYSGTRNAEGYVSGTGRWYSDLESQRDAANEGVDELLAELDQYSRYYNEDAVSYVRDLITKRQSSYDDILKDAGNFKDHWSQWATEDDYNYAVWENDFAKAYSAGDYDAAEKMLTERGETLASKVGDNPLDLLTSDEYRKLLEYEEAIEQERLYSTYDPETYNANVQRINELKKELGNIGFFENLGEETVKKISELSGGAAGWTRKEVLEKELERLEAENSRYLRFADPEEYQRLQNIENAPWLDRTLATVGDLANDVLYGVSKGVENTVEFLPRVGLGLADMIAGEAPTAFKSWVDNSVEDLNYDWAGNTHNIYDDTAARKSLIRDIPGGEQVQKTLKDVAQGVGNLIPAAAATAATGNPLVGEMIFFANSAGGATEEASLAGVDPAMAMQYGAAIGGLETATEKLGGSVFGEASDLTDTALGRWMIKSGADKYVGKGLGKAAYTFASEGVEESIMDIVTPLAQSAFDVGDARETYFGENWKEGWSEVISGIPETFVVGGTVGSVIEGFHSGVSAIANKDKGGFKYNKIVDEMTIIENALKAQEAVKQSKKANPEIIDAFSAKTSEKVATSVQSISETMQKLTPAQRAEVFTDAPMLQMFLNEDGSVSEGFKYFSAKGNTEIISLINKIAKGEFKDNDKVYLNNVSDDIAERIKELTGVDVHGFKVAIEARQLQHIIKDHGENGKTDRSMRNSEDVAKIEYVLDNPDAITKSGKTQAYSYMKNGYNRTADTVLYEKNIGEQSYYAVQAIPDTKAKTLYIVTAFIGQSGYQKGASQLINANSPNATSEIGSAITPTDSISQGGDFVNGNFSTKKGQHISPQSDVQAPNQTPDNELSMNAVNDSISQKNGNVNSKNLTTPVGQAEHYAKVLKLGENGTQGLVSLAEGLSEGADLGEAALAFNALYSQGRRGQAASAVKNASLLSPYQREAAYQAGVVDGLLERGKKKTSEEVLQNDSVDGKIKTTQSQRENSNEKENESGLLSGNTVSDGGGHSKVSSEGEGTSGDINSRRVHGEAGRVGVLSEDSEGRRISSDTLSEISETAVVDEDGKPISLYHSTDKSFDKFAIGDIGFHFGLKGQADTRASARNIANPRYINAYLNIKNPLKVNSDYMNWHANSVALNLWNEGILSNSEMQAVVSLWSQGKNYDSPAAVKLREILEGKGYDGIAYPNDFEGEGTSYIAFHDEQIVRVNEDAPSRKKQSGDTSDHDVQQAKSDQASSSEWSAERIRDGKAKEAKPISEIIEQIRHDFGINITKGHVRGKGVLGQYSRRDHGIRTKIANDLPTVAHELGHALDQRYGLTDKNKLTKETKSELVNALGDLKDSYKQNLWVSEGLAEYMRRFLQNRDDAARSYPEFTKHFLNSLSRADRILIDTFADEINAYYALDADTATSSIRLREEGVPDARTPLEKAREMGDGVYQAWVDANHGIKLFDEATGANTYKLASNAAYSDAIAGQIITGELTDANGQYVGPGLKAALEGVNIGDKKIYREFGEYLVLRHGPERLSEGMRIFADERKNNASFMEKRAGELEAAHPEFKEAADRLYKFQKQFLQTWAVDTGLLPADIAEAWAKRWNFYVPLNRAVGKAGTIGAKRGYANQNSTVKKAIGSGLDIVHPVDNIINNIVKMVNAGVRNNVMLEITTQAEKVGADATFLEKVPTPMKKKTADLTGVKAKLHDAFGAAGIGELLAEVEGESETQTEYSYHKTFSEQIDDVVSGKHDPVYDLYVGKTPDILINIGFDNKPLLMRNSKIREILTKHPEMSIDLIKKIPDAISDPVMILKSKTNPTESVVVITDILTDKGHMIIPVWVSQDGTYLDVEIGKSINEKTNFVASAYGRNVKGLIEYALNNNEVLFYAEDKKRVSSLLATHGLQLPARLSISNSTISISHKTGNVNKNFSTNSNGAKSGAWSKVDEIIESAIDDVLIQYGQGKAHGDVVTVLRNGKQEFWKINDALLLESLTSLSQKKMNGIMEAYAVVSRFMTSNITGNNIIWSIFSNFPRDLMTFFTYSKQKNPLKSFPAMGEAYLNKVTDGKADSAHKAYIYEYYGLGGGQTSAYTADVDLAKRARKKLKHSSKLQNAAYYANPLNTLSFISETVESGPRIATYIMMREKGMSPQEAFYESQDITVNFKRGGRLSREFNKAVPFFNASVQGLDKFKRWVTCEDVPRAQRAKAIVGRVTMYVAVSAALGALTYALNNSDDEDEENYRLLSNYTKNTYWNIPLGDGKYFAIPKPREIAVLSTFFETTCEYFGGNDYAYDGFGEYAADNFLPPFLSDFVTDGMDGALGSLGIIGVASDLKANKDFLGRPIESTSLQGYESQDRYTRRTSKIAYWLGQAAAELGLDWSPVQIDYFFSQTLGGYWKVQKALFPVGSENVDWTLGVQNTYVKDNQYSNDIVNWMYDKADDSEKAANSHPDDMDIAIEAKLDSNMKNFYSRYYALTKGQKEDSASRRAKRVVLDMIVEYRKATDNGDRSTAEDVIYSLVESVKDTSLLPAVMQSTVKDSEKNEIKLTDIQYVEYQTTYNGLYWEFIEDNLDVNASDAEKVAVIRQAQSIAKERATELALKSAGGGSSGFFEKYSGIDDKDLVTFKAQIDLENDKDGGLSQEELIDILEGMVADGLSKEDAYTLFKSRYPTSDKNNPWRRYAP